jgi:hypothetical protein
MTVQQTDLSSASGSVSFVQDALDVKHALWHYKNFAASGGVSDYGVDTANGFPALPAQPDFCRISGGVRRLHERMEPANYLTAPIASRSPTLLTGVAGINGHAAIRFRDSGGEDQSLLPVNPAAMAHTISEMSISMLLRVEATNVTNWIISPLIHATATNDFALAITNSGALQYARILNGNTGATRWQEQTATDLDSLWHHFVIGYNTVDGFRMAIDGVPKARAVATPIDVNGFTAGQWQVGTRGTSLQGADFDLARLTLFHGVDLFRPANAALLTEEYNAVTSVFAY